MVTRRIVSRQAQLAPAGDVTYPDQSNPLDPAHPGIGEPLRYTSDLAPWTSPQFLHGGPMRAPGLVRNPVSGLVGAPVGSALAPLPVPPTLAGATSTTDPHHYARVNSTNIPATQSAQQTPFLTAPAGYRNFLLLRNPNAAGNLYVDFGQSAGALSALKLTPGQMILFDEVVPQDDLYVFADAAAMSLSFGYGNIAAI